MERLKETNDWEQELKPNLMSKQRTTKRDGIMRFAAEGCPLSLAAKQVNEKITDNKKQWGMFDIDNAGKTLHIIRTYYQESSPREFADTYFMILNADGTYDPENYFIEVPDIYNYQELLHAFKERNGWSKK